MYISCPAAPWWHGACKWTDSSESDKELVDFFSFWVEGVLTTAVAILGIFGNTIVSFIIAHKEMRNSFNLLLVSLACFDSTYVSKT